MSCPYQMTITVTSSKPTPTPLETQLRKDYKDRKLTVTRDNNAQVIYYDIYDGTGNIVAQVEESVPKTPPSNGYYSHGWSKVENGKRVDFTRTDKYESGQIVSTEIKEKGYGAAQ